MKFELTTKLKPTGDQPKAIEQLIQEVNKGKKIQTLLGVTGSGKTFTIANVIQKLNLPTLIIAHNKTLAAQLYQEFRDFFKKNAVSYFVSYYDYYQPEAYIPTTDTYIEKTAQINEEIDKLRLSATINLLTRPDTIVISSVSSIYNIGNPIEYKENQITFLKGQKVKQETVILALIDLQFEKSDILKRGSFQVLGNTINLWPTYQDIGIRFTFSFDTLEEIQAFDIETGELIFENIPHAILSDGIKQITIYASKHFVIKNRQENIFKKIEQDLKKRVEYFLKNKKIIEANRIKKRVLYDLKMIKEFGFVNGIENYSIYFDGRKRGEPPYTLIDYFLYNIKKFNRPSFLTIIDESHITIPQIRGMYFGDKSRKQTLIDYGFRLETALDNRPLKFDEFLNKTKNIICMSATPSDWEKEKSSKIVEQIVRPTGLVDPIIELRSQRHQIKDVVIEIINHTQKNEKVLVLVLTKKQSELLSDFLNNPKKIKKIVNEYKTEHQKPQDFYNDLDEKIKDFDKNQEIDQFHNSAKIEFDKNNFKMPKVAFLHSDIDTLKRSDILDDLRTGKFDVIVGINLLREGLDLPEVTLVAILDADSEGFLRGETALIQSIGRAARNVKGKAILYAQKLTKSIKQTILETYRRRKIQINFNKKYNITPKTVLKPVRKKLINQQNKDKNKTQNKNDFLAIDAFSLTPLEKQKIIKKLKKLMNKYAKDLDFENAKIVRDKIFELEKQN